jgi:hypothetical protein
VPTSQEIRIAAGHLVEQQWTHPSDEKRAEELERIDKTLVSAVLAPCVHGVLLACEHSLKGAEGAPRTCEVIVSMTGAMDVARRRGARLRRRRYSG